jgi:tetrahydromethanopterin S-methyltransferase subunit C
MKVSLKNIHKSTPAKWSKIGLSCVSVSAFISGYGLTTGNSIIGYVGLAIGVIGTFVSTLFTEK